MADDLIRLRSPFNGGIFVVPPDCTPEFVEELLKRGFTREDDEPSKPKRKEVHAHG